MRLRIETAFCIFVAILAFSTRLFGLYDWPLGNDEPSTILEERSLFHDETVDPSSQYYRLPRVNPGGYFLHHVGHSLFGDSEGGLRLLGALFGSMEILLVLAFAWRAFGFATGAAASLLLTFWPSAIVASQEYRFYVLAGFFVLAALASTAEAVRTNDRRWQLAAALFALIGTSIHAIQAGVLAVILGAHLIDGFVGSKKLRPRELAIPGAALLVGVLYLLIHVRPLISGWNQGAAWGYGVAHSALAAAGSVGWPTFILLPLGALVLLWERSPPSRVWLVAFAAWIGSFLVLPKLVVYHPPYSFPLEVAAIIVAGRGVAHLFETQTQSRLAAWAVIVAACLGNLPVALSHYADGSRPDFRSAAQFVDAHAGPDDPVVTRSPGLYAYYSKTNRELSPVYYDGSEESVVALARSAPRVWFVIHGGRLGLPDPLGSWLGANCALRFQKKARRVDANDFPIAVFECRIAEIHGPNP